MVVKLFTDYADLVIPEWVTDIHAFRRWTDQDDFPETGRIWWLDGGVWADMSKEQEQIFSHVRVKTEIAFILTGLAKSGNHGMFFTDGVLLTNFTGDFSGIPDGIFISDQSIADEKVRFIEGAETGYTELQGSPDIVLEIVSRSSIQKDTVTLRQAYWEAEIPEYWLVDAREEPIQFDVLRRTARIFRDTKKRRVDQIGSSGEIVPSSANHRQTQAPGIHFGG